MRHAWIIDVLEDLRGFAQAEGLHILAEHLDDTKIVAAEESRRRGSATLQQAPDLFRPRPFGGHANR